MLMITECRKCLRKDKKTCPIAVNLRNKLKKAGIGDRLRYRCKEWLNYLPFKELDVGDRIEFFVWFLPESNETDYCDEYVKSNDNIYEIYPPFSGEIVSKINSRGFFIVKISGDTTKTLAMLNYQTLRSDDGNIEIGLRPQNIIREVK